MSSNSLASAANAPPPPSAAGSGSPKPEDQAKILEDGLGVVKIQAYHMKRALETGNVMDGLKHASTMLSELRTNHLTPKTYYELYMAIFDELRFLTTYLYDAHMSKKHHLSDLYELVQYAGNIVPRLYLMITVGSVYMRVSKESMDKKSKEKVTSPEDECPPIKELMRDMLEMSRGVQHPTRGLFLRYYLSGMTRDYLPDGLIDGPHGTIHDSIHFILQNFIEMNKLWVRLQYQGHSRDKMRREQERRELRLLVGSNLVRLSQLDGLDLEVYKGLVLPSILEEIVSCKDVIAQDYLMEVIIQVFPDEFHLRTLDPFLSATAQLQTQVNVKQIVISLIDRFSSYAERARAEQAAIQAGEPKTGSPVGVPPDVQLFDVFWNQITELVKARPEFSIESIIALLVSLVNLSLNCYPEHLEYVDNVLGFAKIKVLDAQKVSSPELQSPQTITALEELLLSPIRSFANDLIPSMLSFPSSSTQSPISTPESPASTSLAGNFTDLLYLQPYTTRRKISHATANMLLKAAVPLPTPLPATAGSATTSTTTTHPSVFRISSINGANLIFGELCSSMVREQHDGGLFGPNRKKNAGPMTVIGDGGDGSEAGTVATTGPRYIYKKNEELALDWEDVMIEQELVAKMVHLLESVPEEAGAEIGEAELDSEFMLLSTARKHFGEGGEIRIRFTLPPLIVSSIKLARKYGRLNKVLHPDLETNGITVKLQSLYKFIHQTVSTLSKAREHLNEDDHSHVPLFGTSSSSSSSSSDGARGSRIGYGLMSPPEIALRFFLMAAKSADETGFEELAYEFFVQAFTIYEESVSGSKAQSSAIALIIGTLRSMTVFGYENYETLSTKCAVHCSRQLKRVDQCRGMLLVAHLFWCTDTDGKKSGSVVSSTAAAAATAVGNASSPSKREESKPAFKDAKRVLECMQKALKIADSVMDRNVSVELFVEVLESCVWFYEKKNDSITMKYLNSLIDLIQTNLANLPTQAPASFMTAPNKAGITHHGPISFDTVGGPLSSDNGYNSSSGAAKTISDTIIRHFKNAVAGIRVKQAEEEAALAIGEGNMRRWGEVEFGH